MNTLEPQVNLRSRRGGGCLKIGVVAQEIGVEVHVLRHWHDMGVVVPSRTASGHREYTEDHLRRLRIVQACQSVGMSLADIRLVLHRGEAGRTDAIEQRLQWIRSQRAQLEDAERFLEHVIGCTHDLLVRCPDCTRYVSSSAQATQDTDRVNNLMASKN